MSGLILLEGQSDLYFMVQLYLISWLCIIPGATLMVWLDTMAVGCVG